MLRIGLAIYEIHTRDFSAVSIHSFVYKNSPVSRLKIFYITIYG